MVPINPDDIVAIVPDTVQNWTVGSVILILACLFAVLSMLMLSRKMFKPFTDAFKNFIDDWNGEPDRPGKPQRPGVMQRLEKLEKLAVSSNHELSRNSGSSMSDAVHRIEQTVNAAGEANNATGESNEHLV